MEKVIISVATPGSLPRTKDNIYLPLNSEEIATRALPREDEGRG